MKHASRPASLSREHLLRALQGDRRLSRAQLAERLDITPQYLSDILSGKRRIGYGLAKRLRDLAGLETTRQIYVCQTEEELSAELST